MAREKNPAAVALGKLSAAAITPERRAELSAARAAANRARSPIERRQIARKAAMTARMAGPRWLRKQNSAPPKSDSAGSPGEPPPAALPPDLAQLSRAIDELPDDLMETLFVAIGRRSVETP